MLFNLNEFLLSLSFALDFVEIDILGVSSNHGKRVAYMSYKIGEALSLSINELSDLIALAILHDNGISESTLHKYIADEEKESIDKLENTKLHCIYGEENIKNYPFLTDVKNVLLYHHEFLDGNGFFGLKGNEIPLLSQILKLADLVEISFDLNENNYNMKEEIIEFLETRVGTIFSQNLVDAFKIISVNKAFWMDLKNMSIDISLKKIIPENTLEMDLSKIYDITKVFSKIIDSKSKYTRKHSSDLAIKAEIMGKFYKYSKEEIIKLTIAANLHDIGKLAMPNSILDSPNKLNNEDFEKIKEHTYYTRMALQWIKGFEDITEWASNHHEKLNGSGYPYGLKGEALDFNCRLLGCLDIYEALTEERPYRKSLSHEEAMEILYSSANSGFIDTKIVNDINYVFKKYV